MYYLHYIRKAETVYAILTRSVARMGAIVNAGFAEGPFDTREEAEGRARWMSATLL